MKPFAIDPHAVTNAWFSDFIDATGYRTDAERFGWSLVFKAFADRRTGRAGFTGCAVMVAPR